MRRRLLKRSNGVGVTVDWGGDGEAAMLDLAPLPDPAPSRLDPASPMREDGADDELGEWSRRIIDHGAAAARRASGECGTRPGSYARGGRRRGIPRRVRRWRGDAGRFGFGLPSTGGCPQRR